METYLFAENINRTKLTGIINIKEHKIICFCDKEQSILLLKALNSKENIKK